MINRVAPIESRIRNFDAGENVLLTKLYDSVLEPGFFVEFMQGVCEALGAQSGVLASIDVETQHIRGGWGCNIDFDYHELFITEGLARHDKLLQKILSSPMGQFYCTNRDIDDVENYQRDGEVYRRWGIPQGIHDVAMAVVAEEGPVKTFLAIQRNREQGPYEIDECELLNRLVPHVRRAVMLQTQMTRLQQLNQSMGDVLSLIKVPVMVFSQSFELVAMNALADRLVDSVTGVEFKDDFLMFASEQATSEFNYKMMEAVQTSQGVHTAPYGFFEYDKGLDTPLRFVITPIGSGVSKGLQGVVGGGAIVYIHNDQEMAAALPNAIHHMYGFTSAESVLCKGLLEGEELAEMAQRLGKSKETLRTQLKGVFSKTDTHSQAQLVSTLLSSPAYLL